MKALVTGASSGIGRDIAIYLSKKGYDIIAVARNIKKLEELRKYIKTDLKIISKDLSIRENCIELYNEVVSEKIDMFINNASFGLYGEFINLDIDNDMEMINLNIISTHILFKLFLKDMTIRNSGYILNVSSMAAFSEGPLMAEYYATKSYMTKLSTAVIKELKKSKSDVSISVLFPGPVDTNFNNVVGIKFSVKPLSSKYVAKYGVDNMLKRKEIIIPGCMNKLSYVFSKVLPYRVLSEIGYNIQKKKRI